ncbi:MAG: hypothetical protein NTY38_32670 [Acidobacteria bacterium]|nr:hypothetical protein [Acidobacteriota bacterium]
MRTWARIATILIVVEGAWAGADPALAERLLAAPDVGAAEQILAASPGEVKQDVFAALRLAAQDTMDRRRDLGSALRQFRISLVIAERLKSPADIGAAWLGIDPQYAGPV